MRLCRLSPAILAGSCLEPVGWQAVREQLTFSGQSKYMGFGAS